jgi:hypothetical protein
MASIERTAYPRFRRLVTARELAGLSPTEDDGMWARERSRSDEHLLALVVLLPYWAVLGPTPGT